MTSLTKEIKEKLDIVDVVGAYVKLEKAGQNYKARCPFHNEKTPSFFISPMRGSYYCFGCGAKGDIFSFIEHFEGLDFIGALKVLAEKAGVNYRVESIDKKTNDRKSWMFELMDAATALFEENLSADLKAQKYLSDRGLNAEAVRLWRIGFAKDSWHDLQSALAARNYSESQMQSCGLIKAGESGKIYDTFRSRIMFPIFDTSGRVIAFSGRIFGGDKDDVAKYINSPETELFKKSEVLYGLNRAKFAIRRLNFSILVEGQMDLLMSHEAGYENTVATSGTALTAGHIALLKRLSPNIIIAYDNDSAGEKAATRAYSLALQAGMNVKIASMTGGKDPAELILKDKELWKKAIKNALDPVSFAWGQLVGKGLPKSKFVSTFRQTVLPILAAIPQMGEIARLVGLHKMSLHTEIPEEHILSEINDYLSKMDSQPGAAFEEEKPAGPEMREAAPIRRLFAILFALESGALKGMEAIDLSLKLEGILGPDETKKRRNDYEPERSRLMFEVETIYGDSLPKDELEELIINAEDDFIRESLFDKMKKLQKSEIERNEKDTQTLLQECQLLTARLGEIKKKLAARADFNNK